MNNKINETIAHSAQFSCLDCPFRITLYPSILNIIFCKNGNLFNNYTLKNEKVQTESPLMGGV